MSDLIFAAVIFSILLCWVVSDNRKEQCWRDERQDMLDRLMSKDMNEYKQFAEPSVQVQRSDPVVLTEEEEWMREIEMMKSG